MRRPFLQETPQVLFDHFRFALHLRIPESLGEDAARQEIALVRFVPLCLLWKAVLTAIQFERELRFRAVEIHDVAPHRMLAAELVAGESPVSENSPEPALCLGHGLPE
jgi:hypothetical protein